MAKARMSISLDPEDAERIREAARGAGMDVSSYVVRAVRDALNRDKWASRKTNPVFAELDAKIAEAERLADEMPWPPPPPSTDELSPVERAAITARWDAFFGETEHGAA